MKKLFVLFACMPLLSVAQPTAVGKQSFLLVRVLEKNHYKPIVWNDSTSALLYHAWLDQLDESHTIFTEADVKGFEKHKYQLDDQILQQGSDFFDLSSNTFFKRIANLKSLVDEALPSIKNFSAKDKASIPFTGYAPDEAALKQRCALYIKYKLLKEIVDQYEQDSVTLSSTLPTDFNVRFDSAKITLVNEFKDYFEDFGLNKNVYLKRMETKWLNQIAWCYDPHTAFFDISDKKEWDANVTATKYAAGFSLKEEDGEKIIDEIEPGGSVWKSGLIHKGDKLLKISIDGVEKPIEKIKTQKLVEFLSGNTSAEVIVTVQNKKGEIKKIPLVQEVVEDDENLVKSYIVKGPKNLGYIKLPGFYSNEDDVDEKKMPKGCANDVSKEIIKLKKENIAGLILDLRYNGGGSMWEAIQLAGIFVDAGPIATYKDKLGKSFVLKDPNRGTIYDGPLMVLINGGSASASEFLSAALQDYKRALIVGGNSYGKGSSQTLLPLDTTYAPGGMMDGYTTFVKYTTGKFYRINSGTVQWNGVQPDIVWPDPVAMVYGREKNGPTALRPDTGKATTYNAYNLTVDPSIMANSARRIAASDYFKAMEGLIALEKLQKEKMDLPLDWAGFQKFKASISPDKYLKTKDAKGNKQEQKIVVENNLYDKEKATFMSPNATAANQLLLDELGKDQEIVEAVQIFNDWIK